MRGAGAVPLAFCHNDVGHLARKIREHGSVYSVDGTLVVDESLDHLTAVRSAVAGAVAARSMICAA